MGFYKPKNFFKNMTLQNMGTKVCQYDEGSKPPKMFLFIFSSMSINKLTDWANVGSIIYYSSFLMEF